MIELLDLIDTLLQSVVFACAVFVGPGLLLAGAYWLWERME